MANDCMACVILSNPPAATASFSCGVDACFFRPARPPRVAYDAVVEGLAATRRTFELPGRMTLPEIIEVFTDIWEVESTL